jgi:hypothetical protein
MKSQKDKSIRDLVARLRLDSRGWQVVDHWEADLCAIGVAAVRDPRRLVYISTFSRAPGRYDYECEMSDGPNADEYKTTASGESVDYGTLIKVMEAHLA